MTLIHCVFTKIIVVMEYLVFPDIRNKTLKLAANCVLTSFRAALTSFPASFECTSVSERGASMVRTIYRQL